MSHLAIFFNTKVVQSVTGCAPFERYSQVDATAKQYVEKWKTWSKDFKDLGNFGLAPSRYLFSGKRVDVIHRIEINQEGSQKNTLRVKIKPSFPDRNIFTIALAILLLVPGLFLSLFKLFAYLSPVIREEHGLAKKSLENPEVVFRENKYLSFFCAK